MTINQAISKLEQLKNDLPSLVSRSIADNEDEIWQMNLSNIRNGINNEGKELINSNNRFSGYYKPFTESLAKSYLFLQRRESPIRPKIAGQIYNFTWGGLFANRGKIRVVDGKLMFYNYGMDTTPQKSDFFDGYGNKLLGLPNSDMNFVFEMINNEIWTYLKSKGL